MANPCSIAWMLSGALLLLGARGGVAGPYTAGNRAFPATPLTEDPFVADEVSLTATRTREGSSASEPSVRESEFEAEIGKRLSPDLGITLESGYVIDDPVGAPNAYGFQNVETGVKYQFFRSDDHEFLASAGVQREFGGTGAARIGADSVGTTTPSLYFGKGWGDLPRGFDYLKPVAITGAFGYAVSDRRSDDRPDLLIAGGSIQYSLRYLEGNVRYLGLPEFVDRLTPLVELLYTTPVSRANGTGTSGTIAPGAVYSGNRFDLGVELLIPATRAAGTNVGFVVNFHWRPGGAFESVLFGDAE